MLAPFSEIISPTQVELWTVYLLVLNIHCQPCAGYGNSPAGCGVWPVTAVPSDSTGRLILRRLTWALWHRANCCSGLSLLG